MEQQDVHAGPAQAPNPQGKVTGVYVKVEQPPIFRRHPLLRCGLQGQLQEAVDMLLPVRATIGATDAERPSRQDQRGEHRGAGTLELETDLDGQTSLNALEVVRRDCEKGQPLPCVRMVLA